MIWRASALTVAFLTCGFGPQVANAGGRDASPGGSLRSIVCKPSGHDCIELRGLGGANVSAVEVSPDGRNVYATSGERGIAVLRRDWRTGRLRQLPGRAGCLGPGRGCTPGHDLDTIDPFLISADGRNAYALGGGDEGFGAYVLVFRRNRRTGALRQLPRRSACFHEEDRQPCQAFDLALTRAGRHVYTSPVYAVKGYSRDPETGALQELPRAQGCLAHPDRVHDGTKIGCRPMRGFGEGGIARLALSRNGRNLYVGLDPGMAVLSRSRETGGIDQLPGPAGCTGHDAGSGCAPARAADVGRIVVSKGGGVVYVQALRSDALYTFHRDRVTGELSELPGSNGCLSSEALPDCRRVRGGPRSDLIDFTLSPYGRNLYATFLEEGLEAEDSPHNFLAAFGRVSGSGGVMRQLPGRAGCITAVAFRGCARVRRDFLPQPLVVTPGGRDLIVGSWGLRVFRRAASG